MNGKAVADIDSFRYNMSKCTFMSATMQCILFKQPLLPHNPRKIPQRLSFVSRIKVALKRAKNTTTTKKPKPLLVDQP